MDIFNRFLFSNQIITVPLIANEDAARGGGGVGRFSGFKCPTGQCGDSRTAGAYGRGGGGRGGGGVEDDGPSV